MQLAAIFCLKCHEKVDVSTELNEYKTYRVPFYNLDIPSDALENQIGPWVW